MLVCFQVELLTDGTHKYILIATAKRPLDNIFCDGLSTTLFLLMINWAAKVSCNLQIGWLRRFCLVQIWLSGWEDTKWMQGLDKFVGLVVASSTESWWQVERDCTGHLSSMVIQKPFRCNLSVWHYVGQLMPYAHIFVDWKFGLFVALTPDQSVRFLPQPAISNPTVWSVDAWFDLGGPSYTCCEGLLGFSSNDWCCCSWLLVLLEFSSKGS
jgi:hypothetical protein